ncbi:MAG TPA: Ku protein [Acidimicrobiales bacterium]|nr:Ku protein [Acidimicrobiales bacterium]
MARPIWTGALNFGLVNVPVGLYSATDDKTIHFNQLERGTSDRVRNKRVNERTGEEVPYEAIVKGYDLGGGRYVVIEPAELEAVEPGRSRNIEITDFVDLDEIDPVYYKSTYYLAPQAPGAERAYALLRQAMSETNKVGIATFVMRGKEHLVAIRPDERVLALETMYFADEVRDPVAELGTLPDEDVKFQGRELDTAKLLVDSMTTEWQPQAYRDTYREAVEDLIERKSRGEVVTSSGPPPEPAPVIDLMDALRASVEAARLKRTGDVSDDGRAAGAAPATASLSEKRPARQRAVAAVPTSSGPEARASKPELLERAAELGIPGRSKMSRDELEAAVSASDGGQRRAGTSARGKRRKAS